MSQPEETHAFLEAIRQNAGSSGYAHLIGMQIEAVHNGTGAVSI